MIRLFLIAGNSFACKGNICKKSGCSAVTRVAGKNNCRLLMWLYQNKLCLNQKIKGK